MISLVHEMLNSDGIFPVMTVVVSYLQSLHVRRYWYCNNQSSPNAISSL